MENNSNQSLEIAYNNAIYLVEHPLLVIKTGVPNQALKELLAHHATASWAIITADNPGSELLPAEENQIRYEMLLQAAKQLSKPYLPGFGIDPHGVWPAERNLLILEITETEALHLGRQFGQVAIVLGNAQGNGRIVWMN